MKNQNLRRHITCIRTSTHSLPIEYLRKFKVEKTKRICILCNNNEIGNEKHYITDCNNQDITVLRNKLYDNLLNINSQWTLLDSHQKFLYLISAVDPTFNFYFAIFLDRLFTIINQKEKLRKL